MPSWRQTGLVVVLAASLAGCQSLFHPRWTPEERSALSFNVQGIRLGSPPAYLKIFTQVQKTPPTPDGRVVYQVFNPNQHISTAIFWYEANRLRKLELRYFDGSGVETLTISGGWPGLRQFLFDDFGPPSQFGPGVAVVATQPGLDPKSSQFNGEWTFTRAGRQVNLIAVTDPLTKTGVAALTLTDTLPLTRKQQPKKAFEGAEPPAPATSPGPGYSTDLRRM